MNEFDLIRKYFAPLTHGFPGAFALTDDAALISIPEGYDLVVTKDAISEGIHYIAGIDPALIAKKLLRSNLSDLAAMAATPLCYFLAVILPKDTPEFFLERFAHGLKQDQQHFGITLAGGDTVSTLGTASFCITAHGLVKKNQALLRNGAKAGDGIYVSGTLGDSALGLKLLQGTLECADILFAGERDYLIGRYQLPEPRLNTISILQKSASASIDISDGLIQDLGHLCLSSRITAEIYREHLPLSKPAQKLLDHNPSLWPLIYAGGDDYELLATSPIPLSGFTRIGDARMNGSEAVTLLFNQQKIDIAKPGYSHFSRFPA